MCGCYLVAEVVGEGDMRRKRCDGCGSVESLS